jgi:hypothetical protein
MVKEGKITDALSLIPLLKLELMILKGEILM